MALENDVADLADAVAQQTSTMTTALGRLDTAVQTCEAAEGVVRPLRDETVGAAATAATSAGEAATSAGNASTAAEAAATAQGLSETAAQAALTARGQAQTAAVTATTKAGEAETAATSAAGSVAALAAPPVQIAAGAYQLQAADAGQTLTFAAACTVTVPATLPAGWWCVLRQRGTGVVSIVAGGGATLRSRLGYTRTAGQYASISLAVDSNVGGAAADVWLDGDGAL